jgi:hypothetical protein
MFMVERDNARECVCIVDAAAGVRRTNRVTLFPLKCTSIASCVPSTLTATKDCTSPEEDELDIGRMSTNPFLRRCDLVLSTRVAELVMHSIVHSLQKQMKVSKNTNKINVTM